MAAELELSVKNQVNFWKKVDLWGPPPPERPDLGSCWLWTGAIQAKGYANFLGRQASRFARRVLAGEIPDGMELDHLCRVRHCVRPSHLEVVTHLENVRRSRRWSEEPASHCVHGHLRDGTRKNGEPYCRTCHREWTRQFRLRKKASS